MCTCMCVCNTIVCYEPTKIHAAKGQEKRQDTNTILMQMGTYWLHLQLNFHYN